MRLDISELLANPESSQSYAFDEPCPSEFRCASPMRGTVSFTSTGNLLIIRGDLQADVWVECTRCLGEFVFPAKVEISEVFGIRDSQVVGDPDQEDEEAGADELKDLFDGAFLDLNELGRQYLHLAIPTSHLLCSEDCKGLCPQCGVDLNKEQCGCVRPTGESPLAGLAQFLPKEE